MRVLVTGAGGFIGSHVVRRLLQNGCEVAAIVRASSSLDRLEGLVDHVQLIDGDLSQPNRWSEGVVSWHPEACIHTAWYAEPGKYLDSTENLRAFSYSLDLVEVLARSGCNNVVMSGTCFEYDTDAGYLREDGITKPRTLYAACKLALSLVAAQRAAQLGIRLAWARVFYLYGPHEDRRRLVPALTLALLKGDEFHATKGDQARDYMHVTDVASALCALALRGCEGVFNVCSGEPVTMARLMLTLEQIVGRPELVRFGLRPPGAFEPTFVCGDNLRLRSATGWQPTCTLDAGLRSTVEWWKARV